MDAHHGLEDICIARMNVSLGGAHVSVPGENVERERVHVLRPSRNASVAERVKNGRRNAGSLQRRGMRLLQGGGFDMPALSRELLIVLNRTNSDLRSSSYQASSES